MDLSLLDKIDETKQCFLFVLGMHAKLAAPPTELYYQPSFKKSDI